MYTQITKYFEPILSKYQFWFRKGYSAQQCLLTTIEKWGVSLDQNGTCAAFLAYLSKASDCSSHDLLIGKLHVYGCNILSLKLLNFYLYSGHQHV